MAVTKSAWWWCPSSWNGPLLNCWVGTLPVMASSAEESNIALAMAIWMLIEPGPQDVNVAAGWRATR